MEVKEFKIDRDFDNVLLSKFKAFIATATAACILAFDIESPGGYCHVLKSMKEILDEKKAQGYIIATNVDKYAYSAGFFFYLLGDLKYYAEEAEFLFHPAGYYTEHRLVAADLREMLEEAELFDELLIEIVKESTNVDPQALSFLMKNENYLTPADLIYLGFIEAEYELI